MRNAKMDELQAGIKMRAGETSITSDMRMISDTTLMAESKEELKNLLMRVKEESEKASLKLNTKKTKIMASGPIAAAAAAAKSLQPCPTLCDPRWQPTRLPCPWDSPGKNTGVGCLAPLLHDKEKGKRWKQW